MWRTRVRAPLLFGEGVAEHGLHRARRHARDALAAHGRPAWPALAAAALAAAALAADPLLAW